MSELIAMAMAYRNWSQRELAEFLGRDVHNLIPPSGIPKVDVVIRLAEALDWPAAAVLEDICGGEVQGVREPVVPNEFAALNRASAHAALRGRYAEALDLAVRAGLVASSPDEAAEADQREIVAWDGLGRYQMAIEAAQRGLSRVGVSPPQKAALRANLASCYLYLGHFEEAEGVAAAQLGRLEALSGFEEHLSALRAHLLSVRGQCQFWRIDLEPKSAESLAVAALPDVVEAQELWTAYAKRTGALELLGHAHICRGCEIALGADARLRSPEQVLEDIVQALEEAAELGNVPAGYPQESYGWWSLFGTAVAMRHFGQVPDADRHIAIFTNKAYEVAELTGNWSLRERAFNIDYLCGRRTGSEVRRVLDGEDVRILVGTMGRFPAFRLKGWDLWRRSSRV